MKKKIIFLLIILSLIISCTTEKEKTTNPRYIITSPEVAEIVALIQGTEDIVGITTECDYPDDLRDIPKVGTFGKVDYEKIISLNPTLVLTSGLEQELLSFELQKLGIPTVQIYPSSIEEMIQAVRKIGVLIDKTERADIVADSLQTAVNLLMKLSIERLKDSNRIPGIYIEIYGNPIMSVSDSSFVGEVVRYAGGNNIFSSLPRDYSKIKPEEVIIADPDIIIITYPGMTASQIKDRKGWEVISACKNNRIFTVEDIDPDLILRASPRVVEGIMKLQKVLYE
ncbi:MAG: helical backbone metal receptor [Candidatus Cloacimonetes bacterium]|nr:helical backbone metal receptor [Candidatus Cloacimonadota bacterium]